jgi:MFS family permease
MLSQHSTVAESPRRRPLRRLRPRAAYALMAAVIGLALFASGTPSPLYTTYQALFSLSPLTLTLVYATYAFGVLATLLLAGPVSDTAGRRPVLLVALGSLMVATLLFTLADSVAWLFIARGIQGLATGLALSTASAALLDLHPRHDPNAVGLHNGVASAAISQLVFRDSPPWAGATAGSIALAIGLLGIVLAAALDSGVVYILANIVAGTGFGAAFLGALRTLARGPADHAQLRDVSVLRRRLHLAFCASGPRRRARHAAWAECHLRDLRRPLSRRRAPGGRPRLPQPSRAGDVARRAQPPALARRHAQQPST